MNMIKVVGFDPALANMGIARMSLDLDTFNLTAESIKSAHTDKRANKVVRQNSDDLRRARELYGELYLGTTGCKYAFAEIPSGGQSARAVYGFGIAVGLLASCPIPLIQVQPFETKLATVGTKTASKEEMIEWAEETYPHLPWLRYTKATKNHAKGDLHEDNEHMADALAVVHAGIRTDEFKAVMALYRAAA
ncbi:hypothetical protein SAMN05216548_11489 [Faunimonas pinastri]|uniref:Holliday junction resolvase RuvC n=1 Tax=Faunimonas pinastri TaxID=1855383 RepID=A0A1H9MX06_9HYPH|nr:hypothetical protein [Faunimonas pinastri]SER28234.1 hypothetical protein SAMN05216548_11489 [Faunimonas pinastri]